MNENIDVFDGMGDETNEMPAADQQLKSNAISIKTVIVYSVAAAAPAMCIGGSLGFIMKEVGLAVPLAFLIAMLVVCLISGSYSRLSEKYNSCGGTYSYIREVFGPKWGWWVGWLYIGVAFTCGIVGAVFSFFLCSMFPSVPPWLPVVLLLIPTFLVGWYGIEITTAGLVALWGTQMVLLMWPAIQATKMVVPNMDKFFDLAFVASWTPAFGLKGVAFAVLICIWQFLGFETPAYLGEELKGGNKAVKIAIPLGAIAIGLTYVLVTWLWVIAINQAHMEGLIGSETALLDYCKIIGYSSGGWMVTAAVCISCAGCWFAFITALSRMLFDMGRVKALPTPFSKLNKHSAPGFSVLFITLLWLPASLFGIYVGVDVMFAYSSTLCCIAYILICLANMKESFGESGLGNIVLNQLIPVMVILILSWMVLSQGLQTLGAIFGYGLVGGVIILAIENKYGKEFFKQVNI